MEIEKQYKHKITGDFTVSKIVITNHGYAYETNVGKHLPTWYVEDSSDWEAIPSLDERVKIIEDEQKASIDEYFEDREGFRYIINSWMNSSGNKTCNVIICGFFAGSIRNIHEEIYANLGYGNQILSIKSIETNKIYKIGDKVYFKEPLFKNIDSDIKIFEGIITSFRIDSFSRKIEACLTWGTTALNNLK